MKEKFLLSVFLLSIVISTPIMAASAVLKTSDEVSCLYQFSNNPKYLIYKSGNKLNIASIEEAETVSKKNTFRKLDSINLENNSDIFYTETTNKNYITILSKPSDSKYDINIFNINAAEARLQEYNIDIKSLASSSLIALSNNETNIAAIEYSNNKYHLNYFYYLRYTKQLSKNEIDVLDSKVINLKFSNNSKYLLCVCDNGVIKIYDTKTLSFVSSIVFNAEIAIPVQFSFDSDGLIYLKDSETLVFSDFSGKEIKSLNIKASLGTENSEPLSIKSIKLQKNYNDKYIAIQTSNDDIFLYSYNDLSYIKKYSYCDKSCMTDFLFSYNFDYLIQAYENGCIYRTDIKDKEVKEKSISLEDNATTLEKNADDSTEETSVLGNSSNRKNKKKDDSLCFSLGLLSVNDPYKNGFEVGVEYKKKMLLPILYSGFACDFMYVLPDSDFPYTYKVDGNEMEPPKILGVTAAIPVGVQFNFSSATSLAFEISAGVKALCLYGQHLNEFAFSSIYYSPMIGANLQVYIFNVEIGFGASFDRILKFVPNLELGYRIRF